MIASRPKLVFAGRAVKLAVSFAVLVAAYWLYALLAVPLIEPSVPPPRAMAQSAGGEPREDPRLEELRILFSADAWELRSPKIIESDQAKLLMQEPRSLGDRKLQLRPCTIVFLPDKAGLSHHERVRQAVVLQAPEGAILEFDQPLNLRRMEMGRLVGGELTGPVTIRSQGQSLGPEDDLLIVTRNVQISEKEISAVGRVEFRWGPHFGSGQHLVMKLAPANGQAPRRGPNIGGLEAVELRHVERLHLEVHDWPDQQTATTAPPQRRTATPVEVTCRGPLRFDPVRKQITLEDRVTVWRAGPQGPDHQLSCDLLVLDLDDRASGAPLQRDLEGRPRETSTAEAQWQVQNGPVDVAANAHAERATPDRQSPGSDRFSLTLRRIVAEGGPAVVIVPSQQLAIRARRLQYDLLLQRITLDGAPEVILRQGANEVRARSIVYESGSAGRLGRLFADGPGWLRAQLPDRPQAQLYARWDQQLRFRPHEQNQLLSLTGGATVRFSGVGEVTAKQIHFWFTEVPQAKPNHPPSGLTPAVALHGQKVPPVTAAMQSAPAAAIDAAPQNPVGVQALHATRHEPVIRLRPDRMLAQHGVVLDAPQATARLEQLGVWFEPKPLPDGGLGEPQQAGGERGRVGASSQIRHLRGVSPAESVVGTAGLAAQPAADANPLASQSVTDGTASVVAYGDLGTFGNERGADGAAGAGLRGLPAEQRRRFEVRGRMMRVKVLVDENIGAPQTAKPAEAYHHHHGDDADIAELVLENDATFVELLADTASAAPVVVSGQRIHVVEASKPHAAITVVGQPAVLEGRGLKLTAGNINLNRGTNRLWVDGPGVLELPLKRTLDLPLRQRADDQSPAVPGTLCVDWRQRMTFDGRSAVFEQSVAARAPDLLLCTEVLEVQLQQGIIFSESGQETQPQIEQVLCLGGVTIETRRTREAELTSLVRARLADLAWHIPSGAMNGGGPGFMVAIVRNSGSARTPKVVMPFGQSRSPEPPTAQSRPDAPLDCLHVRFQGSVRGNTNTGTLGFYERVQAAMAPVASWQATLDVDDPRALGQYGGVLINCNNLTVTEAPNSPGNQTTLELEATGNTIVEALSQDQRLYTARAQRIAYAQIKDLLVLEGDGRTDAELFYQPQPGAQPSRQAARRILLFPRSGKGWVEGARSLELTGFPH